MSTELIKAIYVKSDGVYLYSKSNNDNRPFDTWKCDSLTDVYNNEGQRGLDIEIIRMLCEYAQIQGRHPSMERYRYCLAVKNLVGINFAKKIKAEYEKLTSTDIATIWLPEDQQTTKAKEYREFSNNERNKYYAQLAELADRKPPSKDAGAR